MTLLPPADVPDATALSYSVTVHTAPSTAAPTTLDAATSSNNQLCSIPLQKRQQMEKYTKVALTIDEQIELLEGRGLDIPDT